MSWLKPQKHRAVPVPEELELEHGERVLATAGATDDEVIVVTSRRLIASGEELAKGKPWHLVDAGRWDPETDRLSVTWVDDAPASSWHLTEPGGVPEAFHERVNASVVLFEQVKLDQERRARVVLRRDLSSDRILAQTIVARGCDPDDPQLIAVTEEVAARLAEQVGREP